jgi:hypothetical protein
MADPILMYTTMKHCAKKNLLHAARKQTCQGATAFIYGVLFTEILHKRTTRERSGHVLVRKLRLRGSPSHSIVTTPSAQPPTFQRTSIEKK